MTPAEIILIIGMTIAVVFALFLVLVLFAGESRNLHVWGSGQPVKSLEWLLYAITGVWLVKWTMMVSMVISHKAPYWGAGICFFLLLMLALFYVLDITVLTTK